MTARGRIWGETTHTVLGLLVAVLSFAITASLVFVGALLAFVLLVLPACLRVLTRRRRSRLHARTSATAAVALLWSLACLRMLTAWQRSRFAAFTAIEIPALPYPVSRGGAWRQLTYHLLVGPIIGLAGSLIVAAAWSGALMLTTSALWSPREPRVLVALTLSGLALLIAAPLLARWTVRLDATSACAMLGPSRSDALSERVETLAESRAEVVAAADAERRRIERDLHDGAQQRLVSLAMNLGLARATLTDVPGPAMDVIVRAHEDAKLAVRELRDLVRGLHPAILTEQDLDAALSGLAARAPFPVRLRVDVPDHLAPAIESVAFFVVSEALTNVTKHASATRAEIKITVKVDRLHLVITDDGVGGATPDKGTGLRGLAQRVGSVDGSLRIDSPAGGPTTITVELPCG